MVVAAAVFEVRNGGERGIIRPLMSVVCVASLGCPRPRFDETWSYVFVFVFVPVSNSGNGGAGLNSSW